MNALSAVTSRTPNHKPTSSAVSAFQAAAPAPASAVTLSPQAQKALSSIQPQRDNIIWGSGPSR